MSIMFTFENLQNLMKEVFALVNSFHLYKQKVVIKYSIWVIAKQSV